MQGRHAAVFFALALASALALANPCVKGREGDAHACLRFSPSAQREAADHGLRLGAPFQVNRQVLLKRGWVPDERSPDDDAAAALEDRDMACGSGWDAVCQAAFRKDGRTLLLTLSAVNNGLPLVGVETGEHDSPNTDFTMTLTTASFIVRIAINCAEGNVSCDDVTYLGTSRKTGNSIRLRGKTMHGMCADGVTPCRFLGYEFRNGRTHYRVLDAGVLSVVQGNKVLLEERGSWK